MEIDYVTRENNIDFGKAYGAIGGNFSVLILFVLPQCLLKLTSML